jgi:phosphate transport system permease protein
MTASAQHRTARRLKDQVFRVVCLMAAGLGAVLLIMLLIKLVIDGLPQLTGRFLQAMPTGRPKTNGIKAGAVGTLWIMALTGLFAVPIGVAAAIFLEEFTTKRNRFTQFIQLNISNLAGVPSIVYGLLGLAVFVRALKLGPSVVAGGATMALLVLPMVIIVTQESLRAVPRSYREGSLALGSTLWQAIWKQVLPSALPGIMTGIILALGRAIGETAPLIVVGAATYVSSLPDKPTDRYTALPINIFDWAQNPRHDVQQQSASAILVLIIGLLMLNSVAIWLRARAEKRA